MFTGFGLALLAGFYALQGPGIFNFLNYHKDRGIEIESTWSALVFLLRPVAGSWDVYHSHGSVNVRSALTPFLTAAATLTLAGLLLAATALFIVVLRRQHRLRPVGEAETTATLAQAHPRLVAGFALLLLSVCIAANKVFSPQYLLWILPLIPLVDFQPFQRRLFFAGALAVCYLTMRIFPDCFIGEIVWGVGMDVDVPLFDGPTLYGAFLVIARNALFVVLTAALARHLYRAGRAETADASPSLAYLPPAAPRPTIRSAV